MALASAGRHDQAIIEWRETIRLAPTLWPARIGLSKELLAIGDAGEAAAQCREILKQEPGAVEAIVMLGEALAARGQVEEAIPHWERALEIDPRNARAHFHLGLALWDRGRSQSAIAHLDEAIRLAPDDVPCCGRRPGFWQRAGMTRFAMEARAVELANRAIEHSTDQEPHAFDALAAGLAETEEFAAAVERAEQGSTIALTRGDNALADAIEQRTRLYRQGLPYRQPASREPGGQAPADAAE